MEPAQQRERLLIDLLRMAAPQQFPDTATVRALVDALMETQTGAADGSDATVEPAIDGRRIEELLCAWCERHRLAWLPPDRLTLLLEGLGIELSEFTGPRDPRDVLFEHLNLQPATLLELERLHQNCIRLEADLAGMTQSGI